MVLSKHLINEPPSLVIEALQGLVYLNPHLSLDVENKVIYRSKIDKDQVALICGGGSGHEPSHAGFVGEGILTAAVAGNVFASPNASQVTKAIELVDGNKGTLIIVKNYTGDVLNFGLAKEQYAAAHPEKSNRVRFLIVGDDVSVGKTQGRLVGRRGLAGTVIVYKIAGALAGRGQDMDKVFDVAAWVASRIGTVGAGLEHCHIPGTNAAESHLKANEIELGMGIHNESGYARVSPIPKLHDLVSSLLDLLTSTTDPERSFLPFGALGSGNDEVVLMVNNLGGLSELELSGIARETVSQLRNKNVRVRRLLQGSFMTSLNMPGFSLTLLLLPRSGESAPANASDILSLLDEKSNAPGWRWASCLAPGEISSTAEVSKAATPKSTFRKLAASDPAAFVNAIRRAASAIIENEAELSRLDSIVGDGDAGLTHKSGAEHVLRAVDSGAANGEDVIGAIGQIAKAVGDGMDGTSGALYSIFFSALVQGMHDSADGKNQITLEIWTEALRSSLSKLYSYTRARPPSRTLVDPLAAFVEGLNNGLGLRKAVQKAADATNHTKDLEAKAGRTTYVEREKVKGVVDPGALGVKIILEALLS
ncbi:dihydroxyacetone kinase [Hysterangium stoloniferum]|nr:dihydroxyacetone kinase [Hysterangium stoloniferum]